MNNKSRPHLSSPLRLGPVSTRWLGAIGVHTRRDLEALGAVGAYTILKNHGYNVSLNLVYGLEGILRDCAPGALPARVRNELKAAVADAIKPRCDWAGSDPLYRRYHDEEWGVPVHNDHRLFEFLILEGAQAGLSWITILRKREHYRQAFAHFDPKRVARFDARRRAALLKNPGIVRNRLKIESTVSNARAFLAVQKEFGSFDRYLWRFVGGRPLQNRWPELRAVPARTAESDALSADLKRRGFRFVGSTICYAFMQAVGMVNDHLVHCHRHRELARKR
jgi:DNA-3-methyladenine glycosylase I